MMKSETISELATAMSIFQGEVKQPLKDKTNPFFKSKYVPLENIVEVINDTASKHGLSFIQYPINHENKVGIVTVIMHKSGEFIETEPIFATPAKSDAQATGSTITYLKRYSLAAVFGITSDVDDDGNAASKKNDEKINLADILKEVSTLKNKEPKALYQEVCNLLNINKSTKELNDAEEKAIISILIKQKGDK